MKTMMIAATALMALTGAAFADGDMTNTYGNIVRVSGIDSGFEATFAEDGSYSDSRGITGTWTLGEQLCITVYVESGPQENCGPWNSDLAVGGSWTTTGWAPEGRTITIEIVAAE
tara:strand:+ start:748 stop:1092 length:345 start_codon:yes stop_codon:yes gene_type:complete